MTKDRFPEFIFAANHLLPHGDRWNYRYELHIKAGHPRLRLLRRKRLHMIVVDLFPKVISDRGVLWVRVGEIAVRPAHRADEIRYNDYFRDGEAGGSVDWDAAFVFCMLLAAQTLRNNVMQPAPKSPRTGNISVLSASKSRSERHLDAMTHR